MKLMITLLISLLSLETVNVIFQGASTKSGNYQVVIDGVSYYSTNGVNNKGRKITTISNLANGAHNLELYIASRTASTVKDGSITAPTTKPVYTKTFQLREGYDMNILIRGNAQVSFTEKRSVAASSTSGLTPMSSTAFNTLSRTIAARRYQSDRINRVKSAFSTTGNYFTTTQVRQLLSYVAAESRRLELAKLSYARVTDPANFSSVYDMLKSEASRDALDAYVVERGGTSVESTQSNPAYGTVMPDAEFTTLLSKVRAYTYQNSRIADIRTALESSSFFTVTQVRQLLGYVSAEADRLSLAKLAYNRVQDRSTFNQLVDLFYQSTYRDEFNNFIVTNGGVASTATLTVAMSDASFQQIYNKARSHFFQKNTVEDVRLALNNVSNNFSTDQVRTLLLLISTESTRLEFAKLGYHRAVDKANYLSLADIFTLQANRVDLENYVRSKQ
jgi:hypothetical protein